MKKTALILSLFLMTGCAAEFIVPVTEGAIMIVKALRKSKDKPFSERVEVSIDAACEVAIKHPDAVRDAYKYLIDRGHPQVLLDAIKEGVIRKCPELFDDKEPI